jgi:hypothetical protein
MILLETIDDLLKELLPAAVPREGTETDEEVTVYEVVGERIHFGETVAYSPLQLSVSPGRRNCSLTSPGTPRNWDSYDTRN